MAAETFHGIVVEVPYTTVPEAYAQRELHMRLTTENAQTLRAVVDGLQRMDPSLRIQSAYDALRWILDQVGEAVALDTEERRKR